MAREIEIKLRIKDLAGFRRALAKLGARTAAQEGGRIHEQNILFDTTAGNLKKRGQLLRIRTESPTDKAADKAGGNKEATLTFKRPVGKRTRGEGRRDAHKVREELELQVSDGGALSGIFEGWGMRPWFRYEKYRTKYRLSRAHRWAKDLVIDLDETPIGTFAELEGPSQAIDRAAKSLGFARRDYIVANYYVLYRQECRRSGKKPGSMVFAKKNRQR